MKLARKMIAFVTVIVTMIAAIGFMPEQSKAATAKPKINVSSKVIYVGGSSVRPAYGETYTFYIKNRPKKYSVTWSSSDENVAKIEKLEYSKAAVTAVSAGKATITADFIDRITSTKYTLTTTVTVKKNAAAITISPSTIPKIDKGETISLSATLYNKDASEAKKGEITDTVRWISSDTSIATVTNAGLVTAIGAGKATLTCYTVQKTSGAYSKIEKATAKKTIDIEVNDPAVVGIVSAVQKDLDTFTVTFGGDYSANITRDNLTITKDGISTPVKDIVFDETKLVADVVLYSQLTDGSVYTILYSNPLVTEGQSTTVKATAGDPVRLEIYTDVYGDKVIAGKSTPIRFRLFNANNVNITPKSFDSSDYIAARNRLTISPADNNTNVYTVGYIDNSEKSVYITEPGKSLTISATYTYLSFNGTIYSEKTLNQVLPLTAVSEASTLSLDGTTITGTFKAGELLDWSKTVTKISVSDKNGQKIVARVKNAEGKYIYSNSENSKILFSSSTSKCCYVQNNGSILPFETGVDTIVVYYGDDITTGIPIGSFNVTVVGARVPSRMIFEQEGKEVSVIQMSDAYGVSTDSVKIKVIDQYGDTIDITNNASNNMMGLTSVIATCVDSYGPSLITYANTDGTGRLEIDALGRGESTGKSYRIKVSYNDVSYGSIEAYLAVNVMSPNPSLNSGYRVEVVGDTNMKLTSGSVNFPKLDICLYEMKGGVKYQRIKGIKPAPNLTGTYFADGDYSFRVYKADASTYEISKGLTTDTVNIVYEENNGLVKYATGKYLLRVFKRTGMTDMALAATEFTLTDTAGEIKWDLISPTTKTTLRDNMSSEELKMVFGECFKLTIGSNTVGTSQIDFAEAPIANNGQVFFRSINVIETININGRVYTLTHKVEINTPIKGR
ncbi:MAG: Ig-like domain-containing protein [Lachnospiraceae bacterium]|nr:Ig-like domain-containing protein [Lachnospiraceae bacterium]